eukprot:CAMPEP_0170480140 /NCGR_PEP_ID=MMETSP0208-20121228/1096_1 /TAXON_ID=197538 /ORGANISM="Strombidium inclinatum, Strain S3" /LENGTH=67 /DNA_ID=CAMNT_0010752633 /DNA_START=780 /DNA_END=983 /DNA_ORIENTATION=+
MPLLSFVHVTNTFIEVLNPENQARPQADNNQVDDDGAEGEESEEEENGDPPRDLDRNENDLAQPLFD